MKKSKTITINELNEMIIFDKDGYHCDFNLSKLEEKADGVYNITIKDVEKSDKLFEN